ncbi:MAG: polyprenyl synthetase family protein [Patescibacteria group bacterium]
MHDASIAQKITKYQQSFEPHFTQYFNNLKKEFIPTKNSKQIPACLRLLENLALNGGKRQRVAFVYESYKLLKNKTSKHDTDALLSASISIELLQAHLLIHDDIVDDAPIRRGMNSTYYSLKEMTGSEKDALGMAIMTGDIAAYLTLQVLQKAKINEPIKLKLIQNQIETGLNTFAGQIYDLERDANPIKDITLKMITELANLKTANYTVISPMYLGLIIANGTEADFKKIGKYASLAGIAFQMQDDLLGVFGNEKKLGKSTLSDIREGKKTALVKYTLSKCSTAEEKEINSILGNKKSTKKQIDRVKEIMKKHKADVFAQNEAETYALKAINEAKSWTNYNKEAVDFFIQSAQWVIEREL